MVFPVTTEMTSATRLSGRDINDGMASGYIKGTRHSDIDNMSWGYGFWRQHGCSLAESIPVDRG